MMDGFQGRAITVRAAIWGESDGFGNPTLSYGDGVDVEDVLIAPSTTSAIEEGRPDGTSSTLALYMADPGFSLKGARIDVDGVAYAVVGEPEPYPPELCPTERNLVVEAVAEHG